MDGACCRWMTPWRASHSIAAGVPSSPTRRRRKPDRSETSRYQLIEEFLRAFSVQGGLNLHVALLDGRDTHHMAEAVFKGLARSLDQATQIDPRVQGVPSTKGQL